MRLTRPSRSLSVEKIPLLALSAASAVDHDAGPARRRGHALHRAVLARSAPGKRGGSLRHVFVENDLAVPSGSNLSAPRRFVAGWQVGTSALVLLAVTGVALKVRARRYLLTGWLWYLGTLVPVTGLVQVGDQALADRYAYIPLIGIFIMIASGNRSSRRFETDRSCCPRDSSGVRSFRSLFRHQPAAGLLVKQL